MALSDKVFCRNINVDDSGDLSLESHGIETPTSMCQSNASEALNQKSFSSLSSCDSDAEQVKQMPLLRIQYKKPKVSTAIGEKRVSTLSLEKSEQHDVSAGIVLSQQNFPAHDNIESSKDSFDSFDVIDSAISREGKVLFDDKKPLDQHPHTENNGEPKQNLPNETPQIQENKISCCSIFCSLWDRKTLFTKYTIVDLVLNIGSIVLYVFDFVTDLLNAFGYLQRRPADPDNLFYFILTIIVIVVPSFVMQCFSGCWEIEDIQQIKEQKKKHQQKARVGFFNCSCIVLTHLLQVGPIYRYIRTNYYGVKSRKEELQGNLEKWKFYDDRYKGELVDINFIRMMESFLESAPQLVLQTYIMIRTEMTPPITVLSCCVSLFGMSVSFVAYERAIRNMQKSKTQLSVWASIVLFLYRAFNISSRIVALALLLNVQVWLWIGLFVGHWLFMTALIVWQKTKFCSTRAKEYVYDFVIGFCYQFAYINVNGRWNRYKMMGYYILICLENAGIAVCWYYFRQGGGSLFGNIGNQDDVVSVTTTTTEIMTKYLPTADGVLPDQIALALVMSVLAFFCIGIFFMLIYYVTLHPQAEGIYFCVSKDTNDSNEIMENGKGSTSQVIRSHAGDNYRTSHAVQQFRSWHSASIRYIPGRDSFKLVAKQRPSSDVITPSPSMLCDKPKQDTYGHRFSSALDVQGINCSCSCLKPAVKGYSSMMSSPHRHNTINCKNVKQAILAESMELGPATSTSHIYKKNFESFQNAASKREHVTKLIEQKQKEKQKIEHKQAQLRISLEKMQRSSHSLSMTLKRNASLSSIGDNEIFNRKIRAQCLYTKPFTPVAIEPAKVHAVVDRKHTVVTASPVHNMLTSASSKSRRLLYTYEPLSIGDTKTKASICRGSFPHHTRTSGNERNMETPITSKLNLNSEKTLMPKNSSATQSASLMNLTTSKQHLHKLPSRDMSFSIRKDEFMESIESSL